METHPVLTNWNLSRIEAIELEPEDFDRAGELSDRIADEAKQWQIYLNLLALFSLEKWLRECNRELAIERDTIARLQARIAQNADGIIPLTVGQFRLYPIASEDFLDRVVSIPQSAINNPESAAHFYVAIEILEERQQAIIRGFLRYDKLTAYRQAERLQVNPENCYLIPISQWETQLDRLLLNLRFLVPSAIPLPAAEPAISNQLVRLTQWLDNLFEAGWQTVDALLGTEALALSFRNVSSLNRQSDIKGAKLIDLGLEVGDRALVLLVAIAPEDDDKVGIRIQLHPRENRPYLPADIELKMLFPTGETVQDVRSRDRDSYIQLKYFKTQRGTQFNVCVALGDRQVTETFVV